MAHSTDPSIRNLTIYSVFVRNHSQEGSFAAVEADLDRIANLGVDVLWLMPIHPIGEEKRKGELGSPYAISDYRGINPEYGDMDSFISLVDAVHRKGMKIIIDVVYNHTSPDALLAKVHPEWYWRDSDGSMGNRVGDWSDIVDLDYSKADLWDYLIESLKGWIREGIDGFRCDVASLLPLGFWMEAKDACAGVKDDVLWLAETVEGDFITDIRRTGYDCLSDAEALRAFDLSYDYDVMPLWKDYLAGEVSLETYMERLRAQEYSLEDCSYKLRFLENHDQDRAAHHLGRNAKLRTWTAFSLFQKGAALIYAGQETKTPHRPALFEKDPVDWNVDHRDHDAFLKKLITLKKDGIVRDGFFWYPRCSSEVAVAAYERRSPDGRLTGLRLGVFDPENKDAAIDLLAHWPELAGETLRDRLRKTDCPVGDGSFIATEEPRILDWGLIE